MAENVTIKINVTADTAAIERVRAQLKSLCSETDDCTKTQEKHSKALDDVSSTQKTLAKDIDSTTKTLEKHSGATKKGQKSWDDFFKKIFNGKKILSEALEGFEKLIKFGIKYLAIEAVAAGGAIALMSVAMKVGNFAAKSYQAALGGISFALAAVIAGVSVFLAASRQFQAVQFAPQYADGATNTKDKVEAASSAMKMFVDDTDLAVLGSKALAGAFKTLSDQAPVTGKTTAVFKSLSDYTTGIGGDLQKNSQELATFLALFQKKKTLGAVTTEGAKLGPDFKKILAEAGKLGIKTYDQFADAAMKGQLGATFDKYKGQLNLLNGTLMGQLKQGVAKLKTMFAELGEPLLGPVTKAIQKVFHIFEVMALRIRSNVQDFGAESVLDKLVSVFERVARVVGDLLTNRLGQSTGAMTNLKNAWESLKNFFEKVGDYMRPLQEAGKVLFDTLHPIVDSIFGNFSSTIQDVNRLILENKSVVLSVGESIGNFIRAWSGLGKILRQAFVDSLPILKTGLDIVTKIVKAVGTIAGVVNKLITGITGSKALGGLGTILAGLVGLKALKFGAGMIGKQANGAIQNTTGDILSKATGGKVNGQTVAQNMSAQVVNISAGSVMVNGGMTGGMSPLTGMGAGMNPQGGVGTGMYGPMMPPTGPLAPESAYAAEAALMRTGFLPGGISGTGMFRQGMGAVGAGAKNMMSSPMGLMIGGQMVSSYGGRSPGVGGAVKSGGQAMQIAGMTKMMGGGTATAAGAATAYLGYKAGTELGGRMFHDDSIKSKSGGALVGAAGGAAIGATIGSVIPVFGTAAGAIVGGIAGAIGGWMSAGKAKKDARKAAKAFVENYSTAVEDAFANGDIDALKKMQANYSKDAMAAAKGDQKAYQGELAKHADEIKKIDKRIETYTKNADMFSTVLGMSADEMNTASTKLGVDLTNTSVDIFKAARTLGVNIMDTLGPALNDANAKLLDMRVQVYDDAMQSAVDAASHVQKAVDAAQDKLLSGDTSRVSIIDFLKKNFMEALSKTGGNVLQAEALANDTLTKVTAPGGSLASIGQEIQNVAQEIGVGNTNTQKLADEVVQTGKLQLQAKLLASSAGINENDALKLLYGNIVQNGAEGGANADALMSLGATGKISGKDWAAGVANMNVGGMIIGNQIEGITNSNNGIAANMDNGFAPGLRGGEIYAHGGPGQVVVSPNQPQGSPTSNTFATTITMNGYSTADKDIIAKAVQDALARYGERTGTPTTSTMGHGGGH